MAKISIIIPIYNAEEHLEKCIESVLGQSEKDIEIILVNDRLLNKMIVLCCNAT